MSKLFLLLVAVLCTLQVSYCRVVREAPVATTTFNDLAKQTGDALTNLNAKFLEFWGVKNNEELSAVVQTHSKDYADKLQNVISQLSTEAKSNAGKFEGVFKSISDKLTETVDDLRTKNPDFFNEADKYKDNFQKSLKGVLDETEKFNTKMKTEGEGISENLEKLVKQLYDNTLETAKQVSTNVEAAVQQANKKN